MEKEVDKPEKPKPKINYSAQGKKNRAAGVRFEAKVRENLENMGWIVGKWNNTIDYDREGKIGKVVPAKRTYNPYRRAMIIGSGFPDLIAFKVNSEKYHKDPTKTPLMKGICNKCGNKSFGYDIGNEMINCELCGEIINASFIKEGEEIRDGRTQVIGIEVKRNGYLDRAEKDKCLWLIQNKVFSRILIAKAVQNGRKIGVEYDDFEVKYKKEFQDNKKIENSKKIK